MACFKPLEAWRGAGGIVFDKAKSTTRISFQLPCGRCIGCRMEKARQWGIRCVHEAKLWPSSYFVTLTYSDEFLPPGGSLCLRDVQLFMKRLRKYCKSTKDNPVRFFLGGEYGDENKRPHYHALLFNVRFDDLRRIGKNARGEDLFTSDALSGLWSVDGRTMGHVSLGAVTFDSAVYCAKYALKKVTGDAAFAAYEVFDADGVIHNRRPEFAVMSRRPGIGAGYYAKFGNEVLAHDNVIVNGKKVRPPRFYDGRSEAVLQDVHSDTAIFCRCRLCFHKRARKLAAVKGKSDNTPARLDVKERLATIAAQKKERKL